MKLHLNWIIFIQRIFYIYCMLDAFNHNKLNHFSWMKIKFFIKLFYHIYIISKMNDAKDEIKKISDD